MKNILSMDEFKDKHYGPKGSIKRDELEAGYKAFKLGALVQESPIKKDMTQEELAEKAGATKSYISQRKIP